MHRLLDRLAVATTERIARWRAIDGATFSSRTGIDRAALERAAQDFLGKIVTPWDPEYQSETRTSNPRFNCSPGIIFVCASEADVAISLSLVRDRDAPFAVRSGGHCTAGFSVETATLIDISRLYDVHVDAETLTATIGAGCLFGRLSSALQQYNLHLPIGDCASVGVAGFLQAGGYSFTSRSFGMGCDSVLAVRMMLADGSIVVADATSNRDLFWAVRGGTGGNFGVVLSFVVRLRQLGDIVGWSLAWSLAGAGDRATAAAALTAIQASHLHTAPHEMTPMLVFAWQPDGAGGMAPMMLYRGTHIGTREQAMATLAAPMVLPGVQLQYVETSDFPTINPMLLEKPYPILPFPDDAPPPHEDKQARYVARDLTEAEWREVLDWFVTSPNVYSTMAFEVAGGAINAVPEEATAFVHRSAHFSAFLDVFWFKPEERAAPIAFLAQFCALFERFWNNEIYQNYPSLAVPDYRANYWGRAFDALAAVKAKYDPNAVFMFPQAAVPRPGGHKAPTWPPAVVESLRQPIVVQHAAPRAMG
jgi:FAD/FMN-containing dehydrogenase